MTLFVAYKSFDWLRYLINQNVIPTAIAESIIGRPLLADLLTLTDRTAIYRKLLELIIQNPSILLTGTAASELGEVVYHTTGGFYHAHNAYLQILLLMGVPGLMAALWFTFRAVRAGWMVLITCYNRTTLAQKWLAMSILTMLMSTVTEPYLFAAHLPAYHFVFFLLLGYLLELEHRLRCEKKPISEK